MPLKIKGNSWQKEMKSSTVKTAKYLHPVFGCYYFHDIRSEQQEVPCYHCEEETTFKRFVTAEDYCSVFCHDGEWKEIPRSRKRAQGYEVWKEIFECQRCGFRDRHQATNESFSHASIQDWNGPAF